jgi:hypothetical protein
LAQRRLGAEDADSTARKDEAEFACDVDRFAELGRDWFWTDEFWIPGRAESWASANALAVAHKRIESSWTHEQLANHFGKTIPTIRAALKLAAKKDPSLPSMPGKMPRARWEDSHFVEVAAAHRSGILIRDLSRQFQKSEPLIRAALRLAYEKDHRQLER